MKREFKIEDFKNIKGFDALTQGERRIEEMLIKNANLTNKVTGFLQTKIYLLCNEFEIDALREIIDSIKCVDKIGGLKNLAKDTQKTFIFGMKVLFEKVLRDHVPTDFVKILIGDIKYRLEKLGEDVDETMYSIQKYLSCGQSLPTAKIVKDMEQEMERGIVIYEPIN